MIILYVYDLLYVILNAWYLESMSDRPRSRRGVRDRFLNYPRSEATIQLLSDGEEEILSDDEESLPSGPYSLLQYRVTSNTWQRGTL